jgi:hypothetical protein
VLAFEKRTLNFKTTVQMSTEVQNTTSSQHNTKLLVSGSAFLVLKYKLKINLLGGVIKPTNI